MMENRPKSRNLTHQAMLKEGDRRNRVKAFNYQQTRLETKKSIISS